MSFSQALTQMLSHVFRFLRNLGQPVPTGIPYVEVGKEAKEESFDIEAQEAAEGEEDDAPLLGGPRKMFLKKN